MRAAGAHAVGGRAGAWAGGGPPGFARSCSAAGTGGAWGPFGPVGVAAEPEGKATAHCPLPTGARPGVRSDRGPLVLGRRAPRRAQNYAAPRAPRPGRFRRECGKITTEWLKSDRT